MLWDNKLLLFKPPSLWSVVTAALGNEYKFHLRFVSIADLVLSRGKMYDHKCRVYFRRSQEQLLDPHIQHPRDFFLLVYKVKLHTRHRGTTHWIPCLSWIGIFLGVLDFSLYFHFLAKYQHIQKMIWFLWILVFLPKRGLKFLPLGIHLVSIKRWV